MKFKGEFWEATDRFEENADGSCSDVFEVYIEAGSREELAKLRNRVKCTIEVESATGGKRT